MLITKRIVITITLSVFEPETPIKRKNKMVVRKNLHICFLKEMHIRYKDTERLVEGKKIKK